MNVSTFANSFNAAAFVLALNSIEKNATTITRDVMAAHAAGKAALALIVSAVARIEFTKPKLNVLRVACARARKLHASEFTLSIDVRGKSVAVVTSASIARKPGAGRKGKKTSTRVKPDAVANANRSVTLAHEQRDVALASAKYLAAALRACGMTDERISAIGKGAAKAATVRAWVAESLATPIVTGKRAPRRAAVAA